MRNAIAGLVGVSAALSGCAPKQKIPEMINPLGMSDGEMVAAAAKSPLGLYHPDKTNYGGLHTIHGYRFHVGTESPYAWTIVYEEDSHSLFVGGFFSRDFSRKDLLYYVDYEPFGSLDGLFIANMTYSTDAPRGSIIQLSSLAEEVQTSFQEDYSLVLSSLKRWYWAFPPK